MFKMPVHQFAVACRLKMSDADIKQALCGFAGVKRRFTRTGISNGVLIVDDYGIIRSKSRQS